MAWFDAHNLFGSHSIFHSVVSNPVADIAIGAVLSAVGTVTIGQPELGALAVAGLKAGDAAQAKKDASDKLNSAIKSQNQNAINAAKTNLNSLQSVTSSAVQGGILGLLGGVIMYPFAKVFSK